MLKNNAICDISNQLKNPSIFTIATLSFTMEILPGLFQLIHTLPPKERELLSNRLTSGRGRKEFSEKARLLDCLLRPKTFDADALFNAWSGADKRRTAKAFRELQVDLLDELMDFKILMSPFSNMHVFEADIMRADKLAEVGLVDLAYMYYKKAADGLVFYNQPYVLGMVYRKMQKLNATLRNYDREKELTKVTKLEKQLAKELPELINAYHLQQDITALMRRQKFIIKTEDKVKINSRFRPKLNQLSNSAFSIMGTVYVGKAKSLLYRLLNEYELAFQAQLKIIQYLHKHKTHLLRRQPILLLTETVDLADLGYRTGRFEYAIQMLDKAESFIPFLKENVLTRQAYVCNTRVLIAMKTGDIQGLKQVLSKLDQIVQDSFQANNDLQYPVFICTLMKGYLKLGERNLVLDWYQRFVDRKAEAHTGGVIERLQGDLRKDHQLIIDLIHLCCLYELSPMRPNGIYIDLHENFTSAAYTFKSSVHGDEKEMPFEKLISKHFIALTQGNHHAFQLDTLTGLLRDLDKLPFKGYFYQEQIYEVFDLRPWILSQVERIKTGSGHPISDSLNATN